MLSVKYLGFFCVGLAWLGLEGQAAAYCTKDTDCKGQRICVNGTCQEERRNDGPRPPPRPAALPGITDVAVVSGKDRGRVQCPRGMQMINKDLNEGAGGDFVFLCVAKGSSPNPITSIDAISSDNRIQRASPGWDLIPGDLNSGAGGKFISLQVKREQGRRALQEIMVTSHPKGGNRCPEGWYWIKQDLNQGTTKDHDPFIHLCIR